MLFALFTTLFMVVYNYTLTIMGSLYIASDLGGSSSIAIYAVVFYAVGNALGVPLGKPLSEKIGTVTLYSQCLFLFALLSAACAFAPTFPFFIAMRLLQGFSVGPLYIVINKLLAALQPPGKQVRSTTISVTILAVSPVVGACWGGFWAYEAEWQWMFLLNIPVILFLALFVGRRLKGFDTYPFRRNTFDGVGYFFYCVSVLPLAIFFTLGQELDWFRSPLLTALFFIGSVCFIFFVLWELRCEEPILQLRLFKSPTFSFALFNLTFLFSSYFGTVILLALWLSLYVNYTPIWISLLLGTMAIAGLLPVFLFEKKGARLDVRIPLALSIICFAVSSFHTMYFNVEINFARIAFSRLIAGIGLTLFLPPIIRLCFESFPAHQSLQVMTVFQFVRATSSGMGAIVFVTIWNRWQVFYRSRLVDQLTPFSQETATFFAKAKRWGLEGKRAMAQLDIDLERQATTLALDDCFYLIGLMMMALLIILGGTFLFRGFLKKTP